MSRTRMIINKQSTGLVLLTVLMAIAAGWSIVTIPLTSSHPVVLGAGGILLVVIILRPYYGALAMVATFWLSTLFPSEGGFTLNRMIGLATVAGVVLPWVTTHAERTKYVFNKLDYYIFGFLGIAIFSIAVNGIYPRSIGYLWELLMGYLLYWLIRSTIDSRNKLRTILWVIVVSNAVVAISVVNTYFTSNSSVGLDRFKGLQQVNTTGMFSAIAIIIVLWLLHQRGKLRSRFVVFKYGLVLLFSGGALLTGNRSGLIILLSSLLVVILFSQERRAKIKPIIIVGLVSVSIFVVWSLAPATVERVLNVPRALFQAGSIGDIDIQDRLYLTLGAWRMFANHPIIGIGFGGFGFQLARYVPQLAGSTAVAHNIYVGTLAEMGILGFLMLIALLGNQFSNLWKYLQDIDIWKNDRPNIIYALAILVGMSVSALFHGAIIGKLFFIAFALGTVVVDLLENTKDAL